MEFKHKVAYILVTFSMQLLVPVWSECDPAACNSQGTCAPDGLTCVCNEGFGGDGCAESCQSACPACIADGGCTPCDPVCDDLGGKCTTHDTTGDGPTVSCVCNDGFTGDACDECTTHADACSGKGTCGTAAPNVGVCACADTHTGTFCQHACPACTNSGVCKEDAGAAVCECPATHVGATCQLACSPACTGDKVCRETPAGGAAECVEKCTDAASCSAKGTCDEETCTCNANQAGDDCSIACSPTCDSTKEVCQKTGAATAECLVDCNKAGTPCAAGGTCTNGVCTCAANKAGKFCQLDCDPGCAAGTECKENAAGDDGECSGASALLATWIIFLAAAFSFI